MAEKKLEAEVTSLFEKLFREAGVSPETKSDYFLMMPSSAERELAERIALLCEDLFQAMGDDSVFKTPLDQWRYLVELVPKLKMDWMMQPKNPPPKLLALIRADILPRLLYILVNYTPPLYDELGLNAMTALIWYGALSMHTNICEELVAARSTPEMMKAVRYPQRELYGHKIITQITKTGIVTCNSESVLRGRIFRGRGDLVSTVLKLIMSIAPYSRAGDVHRVPDHEPSSKTVEFSLTLLPLLLSLGNVILALKANASGDHFSYYVILLEHCVGSICSVNEARPVISEPTSESFQDTFGITPTQLLTLLRRIAQHDVVTHLVRNAYLQGRCFGMMGNITKRFHSPSLLEAFASNGVLPASVALLNSAAARNDRDLKEVAGPVTLLWRNLAECARIRRLPSIGADIVDLKLVMTLETCMSFISDPIDSRKILVLWEGLICDTTALLRTDSARMAVFKSQLHILASRADSRPKTQTLVRAFGKLAKTHRCSKCSTCSSATVPSLPSRVCSTPGCESVERADLLCAKCGVSYCSKECQKRHWKTHKPHCNRSRAP